MNKLNLSNISKGIRTAVTKHSPEILTGIGITGMITTTIMAVRATPKALILIEERGNSLTPIETVKAAWTCYIPAAITGCLSIVCLIGASSVNVRRNAALAAAYTLSESALKEYQEKVVEHIGEKKEQSVRDAIAKDKLNRDPVADRQVILTDKGSTLCYDAISGRYFKSDIDKIKKAVNDINKTCLMICMCRSMTSTTKLGWTIRRLATILAGISRMVLSSCISALNWLRTVRPAW